MIGPPGARTSPPINWSDRLVHGLRRRPVDRVVRQSLLLNVHFTVDQLTRQFAAHASSPATLVTPRRSVSSCSRTKWAHFTARTSSVTSVLGPRRLRQGLLGARTSPPMPGTPRSSVLGHHQQHRGLLAPRCSVIASDVEDSSLLGVRSSLAMPGTPRSSVLGHR